MISHLKSSNTEQKVIKKINNTDMQCTQNTFLLPVVQFIMMVLQTLEQDEETSEFQQQKTVALFDLSVSQILLQPHLSQTFLGGCLLLRWVTKVNYFLALNPFYDTCESLANSYQELEVVYPQPDGKTKCFQG